MANEHDRSHAKEHETFAVKDRMKALEADMMSKRPEEWGHTQRPNESYTVRSVGAFEKGKSEAHMWDRKDAEDVGRKASQLGPNHAASVIQYNHDRMEEKLHRVFVNGQRAFTERGRDQGIERSR